MALDFFFPIHSTEDMKQQNKIINELDLATEATSSPSNKRPDESLSYFVALTNFSLKCCVAYGKIRLLSMSSINPITTNEHIRPL